MSREETLVNTERGLSLMLRMKLCWPSGDVKEGSDVSTKGLNMFVWSVGGD